MCVKSVALSQFSSCLAVVVLRDGGEEEEEEYPSKQCRTATYTSPHTSTSGYLPATSAKRSSVNTTLPLELFSNGMTPRCALWSCTAEKTSSICVTGASVTGLEDEGGKAVRAA